MSNREYNKSEYYKPNEYFDVTQEILDDPLFKSIHHRLAIKSIYNRLIVKVDQWKLTHPNFSLRVFAIAEPKFKTNDEFTHDKLSQYFTSVQLRLSTEKLHNLIRPIYQRYAKICREDDIMYPEFDLQIFQDKYIGTGVQKTETRTIEPRVPADPAIIGSKPMSEPVSRMMISVTEQIIRFYRSIKISQESRDTLIEVMLLLQFPGEAGFWQGSRDSTIDVESLIIYRRMKFNKEADNQEVEDVLSILSPEELKHRIVNKGRRSDKPIESKKDDVPADKNQKAKATFADVVKADFSWTDATDDAPELPDELKAKSDKSSEQIKGDGE